MKTNFLMYTSTELKEIINNLDYMNNGDVRVYGFDTIEEASEQLWEDYEEAIEQEEYYRDMDDFQFNGFAGASDYYSFRL